MPPAAAAAAASASRKRTRKRKRRQVSESDSSSSSSDSDTDAGPSTKPAATPTKTSTTAPPPADDSSDSSSDSSDDTSSSDEDAEYAQRSVAAAKHQSSRSPSPIHGDLPPFMPADLSEDKRIERETALRERFRKFWMGSVADAFKDDLEQLRKEPNLTTARLAVLIDSLGAGAETFKTRTKQGDIDEMELVLDDDLQ